ncbi:flagellar basal body P-ring formation chaperone FlgA [Vibrio sp. ZSDE26]|uniref:Flagella basal body P-ring formation protein FlgA n=1 Tax=Vibrio amylolyticus TaxID=2847292 RepID=A0A9X2BGY6_9VIBR|nr:flagellar basal body P-ring formation chaperone FlgA [Vibrio amylolyticus]MCK6263361.1 flagellar basal body P-ring formation chaperone FlgA [Vibrio amylolyticus]
MRNNIQWRWVLIALLGPFSLQAEDGISTRDNPAIERALTQHIKGLVAQSIQQNQWRASGQKIAITLPQGSHRLASCKKPLAITRRDNRLYPAGRLRFNVQCSDNTPWSVNAQANVDLVVPMVYVTRTIAKDSLLTAEDVTTKPTSLASINRDFISQPNSIIGQRALRQVRNGQLLSPERVSHPFVINKGDSVIIEAVGDSFSASMLGLALDNGYLDQQIRVKNNSSGKTIRAVVLESGKVHTLF